MNLDVMPKELKFKIRVIATANILATSPLYGQHSTVEAKEIIDKCRKVIEESYYYIAR